MNCMEDTMLMSYVLDAGKNRHNMDTLSEIHLNHKTIAFKDLVGTGKKEINFADVELEKAKDYAAEDADITFRLYKKFYKSLKEEKMVNIYEVFEKPMIKILAFMEIAGIKIDNKFLKDLSSKFENFLTLAPATLRQKIRDRIDSTKSGMVRNIPFFKDIQDKLLTNLASMFKLINYEKILLATKN